MSPMWTAARAGFSRGTAELRQTFTNGQDIWQYLFFPVILLVVMFFMRDSTVPGTTFSLGTMTLPSTLGMLIVFTATGTLAVLLTIEREDGTLLRAKAVPNGMIGYLIGKIVLVAGMTLVTLLLQVIPAPFILNGFAVSGLGSWMTLAWVVALGLLATLPLGAVLGSVFSNPRNMGLVMMPIFGLSAVSGIFYPLSTLPVWVQWLGQVFPIYWLGLGMRSALLPGELAAVEIGGSWRHLETVGVLGAWAVVGLVFAPILLRRMARRESGSSVAARREKAIQRV
jgi:ABC-2 type transport system permease protein